MITAITYIALMLSIVEQPAKTEGEGLMADIARGCTLERVGFDGATFEEFVSYMQDKGDKRLRFIRLGAAFTEPMDAKIANGSSVYVCCLEVAKQNGFEVRFTDKAIVFRRAAKRE